MEWRYDDSVEILEGDFDVGMKLSKEQTATVSWSTLISILGSLGAVWAFAAPIAQTALAGEIERQISKQVAPLTAAQVITITSTVNNLRKQIASLEFKKDMCAGSGCWTLRDAEDLQAARDDIVAAQKALNALKQ